ncbi:type II secretion system GspH family protein [Campylobacter sp. JMF_01 NE2]|uniref:type II secretion system protein n=1 Tax=unclassified Campylobacter TaxID=2593542 RepID=UPI0022E9F45B|nr:MULTISPECIES: type II secretion system protein [unclassified Campylobacter]MDA3051912.1 type II secretion system GspH family protein [Campylobacter sp. JMF_03 NE3]MDA3066246.1 type II secretion system GspH family protein [Campylobacter sp. JMF_01 NE2]MDA3078076.1 type II secretion system GspH family protein [Campylobacter sp. JMF_06 NA1]
MKNAFTMIELIFVIVVLGILAGVAVPRLAMTRDDATVAKMRGDLASIRSGISLKRGEEQLKGKSAWPDLNSSGSDMFGNVLQNDLTASTGKNGWKVVKLNKTYQACVANNCTTFTYYQTADATHKAGTFDCDHTEATCKALAE